MVKGLSGIIKGILFNDFHDIPRVIYLYRYLSCLITSIFYLIGKPEAPFIYKFGVCLSLLLAAKATTDLYIRNRKRYKILEAYIFAETIGITLLLFPTGGISSPFIWYALNPVLVAVSFLPLWFCWANLFLYISSALLMSHTFFNENNITLYELFKNNSNNILVLILITFVVAMLSDLTKQIRKKAEELEEKQKELAFINISLEESIESIMTLYQTVEAFSNQSSMREFLNAFTEYAAKLTKTTLAFFWIAPHEGKDSIIAVNSIENIQEGIVCDIEKLWDNTPDMKGTIKANMLGRDFIVSLVKSQSRTFGITGIEIDDRFCSGKKKEYEQKLGFIADLSAVILERFHYESLANNLVLMEEQNRIASEMHDNVSQRMFSIACAVHVIKAKWREMGEEKIESQLELINESSKNAMKELRLAIYGLSYKKRGEKVFESNVRTYFNEISKLNNVDIKFNLHGDPDILPTELKKAVHRIIYEATGNAVRHGKCTEAKVDLITDGKELVLVIKDNGTGFTIPSASSGNNGLGIHNMKGLVESFNGSFNIKTGQRVGTEININIPCALYIKERGDVI